MAEAQPVISPELVVRFLRNAHIFASTVQDVMGKKYLEAAADQDISYPQFELLRLIELNGNHQVREIASFLGVSQAAASKRRQRTGSRRPALAGLGNSSRAGAR